MYIGFGDSHGLPTVECSHSNSIAVDFGNQLAAAGFIHQLQFSKKSFVFYIDHL